MSGIKPRLQAVPLSQLTPSCEQKEIGKKKKNKTKQNKQGCMKTGKWEVPLAPSFHVAPIFFSPISFCSHDRLSWERRTVCSLYKTNKHIKIILLHTCTYNSGQIVKTRNCDNCTFCNHYEIHVSFNTEKW